MMSFLITGTEHEEHRFAAQGSAKDALFPSCKRVPTDSQLTVVASNYFIRRSVVFLPHPSQFPNQHFRLVCSGLEQ